MKNLVHIISIGLAFGMLSLVPIAAVGQQNTACSECSVIEEALKAVRQLGPGASRQQLDVEFEMDGGLQDMRGSRYVYRRCHSIKIDVRFEKAPEGMGAETRPSDRLVSVSRPYLELPFAD